MTHGDRKLLDIHVGSAYARMHHALTALESLGREEAKAVLRSFKDQHPGPVESYLARYRRELGATLKRISGK